MELQHTRDLRLHKLDRVIRLFSRAKGWTRKELEIETGYSYGTISNILQTLLSDGIVREESIQESSGGRKPHIYTLDGSRARFLSLDIGTARIKWALQDVRGMSLERGTVTDNPAVPLQQVVEEAFRDARRGIERQGLSIELLHSVAISIPGHYRPTDDCIVRSSTERIGSLKLAEMLDEFSRTRIVIESDAHVASRRDIATMIPGLDGAAVALYLLVTEEGVGSSIVIGNRVHYGAGGHAGEVHVLPVRIGGEVRPLGEFLDVQVNKDYAETALGRAFTIVEYVDLLVEGDAAAVARYRTIVDAFAEAIYLLDNILDPDFVIISGIYNALGSRLADDIRDALGRRSEPHLIDNLQLLLAPSDPDLMLNGLAYLQVEEWRKDRVTQLRQPSDVL